MRKVLACRYGVTIEVSPYEPTTDQILMMLDGAAYWADADGSNPVLACAQLACRADDCTLGTGALGSEGQYVVAGSDGAPTWTGAGVADVRVCDSLILVDKSGCQHVLRPGTPGDLLTWTGEEPDWVTPPPVIILPVVTPSVTLTSVNTPVTLTNTTTVQNCVATTTYVHEYSLNGGGSWTQYATSFSPVFTPTIGGSYLFRVTATCGGTSATSNPVAVEVVSVAATFTVDKTTLGTGETVTVTDVSTVVNCTGTKNYVHQYSTNGGVTWATYATTQHTTLTPTATGTYLLRLTVTCAASGTTNTSPVTQITVVVPVVTATLAVDDVTVCRGGTVNVTATATSQYCAGSLTYSHQRSIDGGINWVQYATTQNAAYTPTTAGTHLLRIVATCGATSATSATQTVTAGEVTASLTVSSQTITVGTPITLTGNSNAVGCLVDTRSIEMSTDGGVTWAVIANVAVTVHTPAIGTIRYRYVASCSTHGCSGTSAVVVVSVGAVPVLNALISITDNTVAVGVSVPVTNGTTVANCTGTAYSHQYSSDNGVTWTQYATATHPTFIPTATGTWLLRVVATCGALTSPSPSLIVQVAAVEANFTLSSTTIPTTGSIQVTDTSTVTNCTGAVATYIHEYSSDNGGNWTQYDTTASPTFTPPAAGTYLLRLTVTCADHETSDVSTSQTVTVIALAAAITVTDATICAGTGITVTNATTVTGCTGTTYSHQRSSDNGVTWTQYSVLASPTFTPATAGTWLLRVIATCNGISSTSASLTIQVASVVAGFTVDATAVTPNTAINVTDTSVVTNCTGTAVSYNHEFSTNGGVSWTIYATTQDAVFTPTVDGTYRLRMSVACTDHGCSNTAAAVTITVASAPTVTAGITVADATVCAGSAVAVTNTTTVTNCTGVTYAHQSSSDGGTTWAQYSTATNPTFTPATAGTWQIRVIATCGGVSNTSAALTIEAATVTAAIFVIPTTVDVGDPVAVSDASATTNCTGGLTYSHEWSADGGVTWTEYSTAINDTFTPTLAGTYLLRLTAFCAEHGCSNTSATTTVTANVVMLTGLCYRDVTTNVTDWDFSTMIPNNTARTEVNSAVGRSVVVSDGDGGTVTVNMKNVHNSTNAGGYGHTGTQNPPDLTLVVNSVQTVDFTFTFSKALNLTVLMETLRDGEQLDVTSNGVISYHHDTEAGPSAVVTGDGTGAMFFDADPAAGGANGTPGIAGTLTVIGATTLRFTYTSDDPSGNDNVKLGFNVLSQDIEYYNDPDSDGTNLTRLSDGTTGHVLNAAWEEVDCTTVP